MLHNLSLQCSKEDNLIKSECYDEKGNLTKTETWENGKLVK